MVRKLTPEELELLGFKKGDEVYHVYSISYDPKMGDGFDEFGNYIPPEYGRDSRPLKDRRKFASKEDYDNFYEEAAHFADLCVREYFSSKRSPEGIAEIQKKCEEFCRRLYEEKYKPRLKFLRVVD